MLHFCFALGFASHFVLHFMFSQNKLSSVVYICNVVDVAPGLSVCIVMAVVVSIYNTLIKHFSDRC